MSVIKSEDSAQKRNHNFIGKDGLIHNIYINDQNAATVSEVEKELIILSKKLRDQQKPVLILTEMTHVGKISLSARTKGLSVIRNLDFDKVALLGKSNLEKEIVSSVIIASGKTYCMKYFVDKEKALEWLLK
jgi:hypothetical protein